MLTSHPADFSAACPQKTARHFKTISSLIEHTVRPLEHRGNTHTAMTCPSALNTTSHTLTANPKRRKDLHLWFGVYDAAYSESKQ